MWSLANRILRSFNLSTIDTHYGSFRAILLVVRKLTCGGGNKMMGAGYWMAHVWMMSRTLTYLSKFTCNESWTLS